MLTTLCPVGEWSLATDNCAMWLNGFNDNLPGFPQVRGLHCSVSVHIRRVSSLVMLGINAATLTTRDR